MFTLKIVGVLLVICLVLYLALRPLLRRLKEEALFDNDPHDASLRTCKVCGQKQRKVLPENIPYYDYYVWMPVEPFRTWIDDGKVKACKCVRYVGRPDKVINNV